MLDFSSALYIGLNHPSRSLPGWTRLTLGKPAALEEVPGALQAQRELAALTGFERVVLGASTLHLFCDLFAMLAKRKVAIWIDEAAYPIARWGADRAAALGAPVRTFAHHNAEALRRALRGATARPVIVTDGYSPEKGMHAPLEEYVDCIDDENGLLIVDDTQALGVFGRRPEPEIPFGTGGGGSLRYFDLRDPRIIVVSSLAKAFGAPVAMLGGSREFVDSFRKNSETLMHCSAPSAVSVSAVLRALAVNAQSGDILRRRLVQRVIRFRRGIQDLTSVRTLFPVQPLKLPRGIDARAVYGALIDQGIRPLLHGDARNGGSRISFVLTAAHSLGDIDRAVEILAETLSCRDFFHP